MIWTYTSTVEAPHEWDILREQCAFCGEGMTTLATSVRLTGGHDRIRTCSSCGWWTYWAQSRSVLLDPDTLRPRWSLYGAVAELKRLDEVDVAHGLQEVRSYLLAKFAARFDLHPRTFELTVASVFGDLGYRADVTAYTADGGIDVILRHSDGTTTGVQVKRTRTAIEVEQIRALAGAMVLGGHSKGIFVTTSVFRSGAKTAARRLTDLALPIELLDAQRFLEALRIVQRPPYADYEDWYEIFGDPELATIYQDQSEE